jgi:hypothetical protein
LVVSIKELYSMIVSRADRIIRQMDVPAYADMTTAPENMPPTPIPATALPIMRAALDGAAPHISEPNSKMPIATRNVALTYTV